MPFNPSLHNCLASILESGRRVSRGTEMQNKQTSKHWTTQQLTMERAGVLGDLAKPLTSRGGLCGGACFVLLSWYQFMLSKIASFSSCKDSWLEMSSKLYASLWTHAQQPVRKVKVRVMREQRSWGKLSIQRSDIARESEPSLCPLACSVTCAKNNYGWQFNIIVGIIGSWKITLSKIKNDWNFWIN